MNEELRSHLYDTQLWPDKDLEEAIQILDKAYLKAFEIERPIPEFQVRWAFFLGALCIKELMKIRGAEQ